LPKNQGHIINIGSTAGNKEVIPKEMYTAASKTRRLMLLIQGTAD